MTRKQFLSVVSFVTLAVGSLASFFPAVLLDGKGVAANQAANVWVREVGVLLIAVGVTSFLVRGDEDSPTLRSFFIGNLILQIGLFPIEVVAYLNGTITRLSGILPNSVLHVLLAIGFSYFLMKMKAGVDSTI